MTLTNQPNYQPTLATAWEMYRTSKDHAHNLDHITTVLDNAVKIAREMPNTVDLRMLGYAVVLHDIAREQDFVAGTDTHEIVGAGLSYHYTQGKFTEGEQDMIADAILNHRNSTGKPETMLAKIVADADRIPASSMEYITRTFMYNFCKFGDIDVAVNNGYASLCRKYRDNDPVMHTKAGIAIVKPMLDRMRREIKTVSDYRNLANKFIGFSGLQGV